MNAPISIISSVPVVVIPIFVGHQQNNGYNMPLVQSGQNTPSKRNATKKENIIIKKDVTDTKNEKINNKENVIDLTQEFDNGTDQYILHKDPNLYANRYSPISNASPVSQVQDEDHNILNRCFNDISDIMQYLKADVVLN
jgi:uncharacterized protein (DUF2344 family)